MRWPGPGSDKTLRMRRPARSPVAAVSITLACSSPASTGSSERVAEGVLTRVVRLARRREGGGAAPDLPRDMDELLARFQERLDELVHDVLADQQRIETALAENLTTPLASSLYRGCVETGKDAYEGGTTLNSSGIQALGVTAVADSLLALDEVVFRNRRCSLAEVLAAMKADFEGERDQAIRQQLLAAPKFGDDTSTEAHRWVNRVLQCYVDSLRATRHDSRGGK